MNGTRLVNVTGAELDKLRTLPVPLLAAAGSTVLGAVIAAALTVHLVDQGVPLSGTTVTIQAVPYVQTGLILLGVLPVAQEYAGGQVRTTLAVVPGRGLLLVGKTIAALVAVVLTALVAVGGIVAVTALTHHLLGAPSAGHGIEPLPVLGAAGYLALIGLLSHAVALLVRHLIPALVGVLSLVLIVSPLLASLSEHARWLPDRAAMQLYSAADPVLTATTGTLVMLAWIALIGGAAAVVFSRRDP
ncbi:hypothetical protein ACFS27_20415 [Promicromonospora vindobonensis]|uniref:ABC transporter permease n=1 Tax=Promicromonospora vindobonensis TaxID=195748 RepID=A0ABW5VYE0_9MICO